MNVEENEEPQKAESVEIVEIVAEEKAFSTESTETTQPPTQEEPVLPWPPLGLGEETQNLVETLVGKFFPTFSLADLVESEARRAKTPLPVSTADIIVSVIKHKETNDTDWALRSKYIFHSKYPQIEREV